MSKLENETASVLRRWLADPEHGLGVVGVSHLTRWLVKTAIVLGFAELDARRFLAEPTEVSVPDITAARIVAAGGLELLFARF